MSLVPHENLFAGDLTARRDRLRRQMAGFISTFDHLSFTDVAVLPSDARRTPRGIGQFSVSPLLVGPFKKDYRGRVVRTAEPYGRTIPNRRSYCDADWAVGLIKTTDTGRLLCATACMGIGSATGRLLITQIQGVTDNWSGRAEGLNDGFLWRHTLVATLARVALWNEETEIDLLSAANSPWEKVTPAGYDQVADELGFTQLPNKNWRGALPLILDPAALPAMHKPSLALGKAA